MMDSSTLSPTKENTVFNWSGDSNGNYYLNKEKKTCSLECFMSLASELKEETFLFGVGFLVLVLFFS